MSSPYVFTVRQLTRYVKALIGQDATLQDARVRGEISDLVRHSSGHLYFTLKDEFSQLRCVLFREDAAGLAFEPENGACVIATGAIAVYEPRGQYQLIARELHHAGDGDLAQAFERLRGKLAGEGLFEESRKRNLPLFPLRIAVITSPVGAALHDVLTTLRSRWPAADVVVIPTAVSGPGSAPDIARSLDLLRRMERADVALLVRGGGDLEDLAGFNAESVARAIAASPVPVITGIGHETDVTIADLVADRRAATPTGAALAATPDLGSVLARIRSFRRRLEERLRRLVTRSRREFALLRSRPVLCRPGLAIAEHRQRLDDLHDATLRVLVQHARALSQRLFRVEDRLRALSPKAVLRRGYAIARLPDGTVLRSARQVVAGGTAEVILAEGSVGVRVESTSLTPEGGEGA